MSILSLRILEQFLLIGFSINTYLKSQQQRWDAQVHVAQLAKPCNGEHDPEWNKYPRQLPIEGLKNKIDR